jgi:hypothetical protein
MTARMSKSAAEKLLDLAGPGCRLIAIRDTWRDRGPADHAERGIHYQ